MFKINDNVVYPGYGVALIEAVIEKNVGATSIKFFKLTFVFKDMTILVPIYNAETIGIRRPSEKMVIEAVVNELYKQPERKLEGIDFTPSGWNRRNKDYQSRIQGGQLIEIARIYRDLMFVAQTKDLSFGERGLLQTTEELLAQELQVVHGKDRDGVLQVLRRPFKQFMFNEQSSVQESVSPII